jgi:hypothetical protein
VLKSSEKGDKPYAARSVSDYEVDELYRKGQLGSGSPETMLNTLWFNNTLHFGMKGDKEHKDLCWGDIQLKKDETGELEYLEYTERQTKTRTGENVPMVTVWSLLASLSVSFMTSQQYSRKTDSMRFTLQNSDHIYFPWLRL